MTFPPSILAANTCGVLGSIFLSVNEVIFFAGGPSALYASLLGFPLYWILGFLFSLILLLVLRPVARATSRSTSLRIFIAEGAAFPVSLEVPTTWLFAHGSWSPFLDPDEIPHTAFSIASFAVIGAVTATAAWHGVVRKLAVGDHQAQS